MKHLLLFAIIFTTTNIYANDLISKTTCTVTYVETKGAELKKTSSLIEIKKGRFNTEPPIPYLYGIYFESTNQKKISIYMMDLNKNEIAISVEAKSSADTQRLVYLRLNPSDSLNITIPVAPSEGPTWDPTIRELNILCKPKSSIGK
jgi:hypothetical protein